MKFTICAFALALSFNSFAKCSSYNGIDCSTRYTRIQAFKDIRVNENSNDEARDNLQLVLSSAKQFGLSIQESTKSFITIQRHLGGVKKTTEARLAFKTLLEIFSSLDHQYNNSFDMVLEQFLFSSRKENSLDDTLGNLVLVKKYTINKFRTVEFSRVNAMFNRLLVRLGGSKSTENTRYAFRSIANNFQDLISVDDITLEEIESAFISLYSHENAFEDALKNFSLISRSVTNNRDFSLRENTRTFNNILNHLGGAKKTEEARHVFNFLINNAESNHYRLAELTNSFYTVNNAENQIEDAIGNMKLILRAEEVCDSLEQAVTDFIDLQNQLGGSKETDNVRNTYRDIYGI